MCYKDKHNKITYVSYFLNLYEHVLHQGTSLFECL